MADVDAPTTLPQSLPPPGLTERIGAVVVAPVRALRALERDEGAHPIEPFVLYALVMLSLHAAESYRALAIVGDAPARSRPRAAWRRGPN